MTPLQIAKRLRKLSQTMIELGATMDYVGGFSPMAARGCELMVAGEIAEDWAVAIEAEHAAIQQAKQQERGA